MTDDELLALTPEQRQKWNQEQISISQQEDMLILNENKKLSTELSKVRKAIKKGRTAYKFFALFLFLYIGAYALIFYLANNEIDPTTNLSLLIVLLLAVSGWGMLIMLGRCAYMQGKSWIMWCGGTILLFGIPALIALFNMPAGFNELEAKLQGTS